MGCVSIVAIALSAYALVNQHSTMVPDVLGCHLATSFMTGVHFATIWEAQAVFDLLVFVLTILKTLRTRREPILKEIRGKKWGLTDIIVRDGALYFAIMVIANIANILTFYLADPILKGVLSTFASCISVTLMSRLMLNLYEAFTPTDGTTACDESAPAPHAPSAAAWPGDPSSGRSAIQFQGYESGRDSEDEIEMDVLDVRGSTSQSDSHTICQ